ncbi:hypothetical protein CJ207_17750, partial [Klebsiella aerogenes]
GFWLLDDRSLSTDIINHPEQRRIHPEQYLAAVKGNDTFTPLVLMPWLPGPEYSVDILLNRGKVLCAIGRRNRVITESLLYPPQLDNALTPSHRKEIK